MKIYVVQVTPEASHSRVSQEGYTSYEAAKAFIESRANSPKPLRDWVWMERLCCHVRLCFIESGRQVSL